MTARYRAWQFIHPDVAAKDGILHDTTAAGGLRINSRGGIAMVEDAEAIRQAILLLLSTAPGERVMRPDYGCDLGRLVFAPNDDATAGLAIHYVQQALARWEPRIQVVKLDAGRNPQRPERLDIVLDYLVTATQQTGQLTYALNLAGEEG